MNTFQDSAYAEEFISDLETSIGDERLCQWSEMTDEFFGTNCHIAYQELVAAMENFREELMRAQ